MPSLIITLLGADRPGLVGTVSDVVQKHGGNWLESRMAHLAGQFAGIVQVDVTDDHVEQLVTELQALSNQGLNVVVETDTVGSKSAESDQLVALNVVGADRPGIVRQVTQVLSKRAVNVEEFHTECVDAPMSGERLFKAVAQLGLPEGVTMEQVQDDLEQIALDLMVDITLAKTESALLE